MAFWGAPIPQADHAMRACRTSIEMFDTLDIMRREWKKDGRPDINIRLGLNTGDMIVGNMGGLGRFEPVEPLERPAPQQEAKAHGCVRIGPAEMAFTRIFSGPRSYAR